MVTQGKIQHLQHVRITVICMILHRGTDENTLQYEDTCLTITATPPVTEVQGLPSEPRGYVCALKYWPYSRALIHVSTIQLMLGQVTCFRIKYGVKKKIVQQSFYITNCLSEYVLSCLK